MAPTGGAHSPGMKALAPTAWVGFAALFAASCAITVTVPGETSDATGSGTGGAGPASTSVGPGPAGTGGVASQTGTGTGKAGAGGECGVTCSAPPTPGSESCECVEGCGDVVGGGAAKISCAPITDLQGTHKVECVCTLKDFSGACFELEPANLCDFEQGCCANYFSGK